jgi:hypothetical protein
LIYDQDMSYCDHCEGQRFDRARVLRALRQVKKELRAEDRRACAAIDRALNAVKALDLPHLEIEDDEDLIVH